MSCLPCFNRDDDPVPQTAAGGGRDFPMTPQYNEPTPTPASTSTSTPTPTQEYVHSSASSTAKSAKTFSFRELAMATRNFRQECLLGEGGFGRVFKGELHSKGIVVAVKQLDRTGLQENIEFVEEVMNLSHLNHPNLVNLIGYCADGSQRLLVYEFVPMGSLNKHLFGEDRKPLDWNTRMKIACGIANGLEYLHEKANPPVIYRRLKPSNVLLDEDFAPKLSDYGLAKIGTGGRGGGDSTNQSSATTLMSTFGYSAPEQTRGEEITVRSDIYCFGIILLELITGRRVVDTTRPSDEQNLVTWAQPIFKDPKRFTEMADPRLNNAFPVSCLNQAVGIAAMCLQEEAVVRPMVGDIVSALSVIAMSPYNSSTSSSEASFTPPAMQRMEFDPNKGSSSVGSNSSFSDSHNGSSNYVSEKASVSRYDMETADDSSCESSYYQSQSYGGDNSEESSCRTAQQEGDSLQESSYQSDDGESSSSSEDDSGREEDGSSTVSTKGTSNTNSVDTVSSSTSVPTTTTSSSSASSSSKRSKRSSRRSKKPKSKRSSRVVTFREPSVNSRYSTSKKHNEAGIVSEPEEQQEERASSSSSSSDEETGATCNNSSELDQRAPRKGSKTRPRKGSGSRKHRRRKNTDGASDRSRASGKPSKDSLRLST